MAYLVLQTSFLTTKQYKAYKSLEAYNQFVNGWVKDVQAWSKEGGIIVTGRVSYSYHFFVVSAPKHFDVGAAFPEVQ